MATSIFSRHRIWMPLCLVVMFSTRVQAVDLLSEDFEGLTLRPVVTFESELREREAWQEVGPEGPAGWTEVNLTTVNPASPGSGVTEFAGWRFVDKDWWILTSGDQDRSQFLSGSGIVAVADPDEWDDFGDPAGAENNLDPANGLFDSKLVTPPIVLSSVGPNEAKLFMHSSWRFEELQTATITAVYDRGTGTESTLLIDRWASEASDQDFKPDATNESLTYNLQNPAGASTVELEFRLQGNNDWWWAIDNVKVFTGAGPGLDGVLRAIIDRGTGEVRIENTTGATIDLRGYSLRSQSGVFDEAAATFLADTDPNWLQATQAGGTVNDLSEVHLTSDAFPAEDEINFGNVWQGFYRELSDISFEYLVEGNDDPIQGIIEFVGNEGVSYEYLDLNFSGEVDILDWEEFKEGFGANLAGLTEAERYSLGDLDNDNAHTLFDFVEFQRSFELAYGSGSFSAMLQRGVPNVPEPSTWLLLGLAASIVFMRRRIGRKLLIGACCLLAAVAVSAPDRAHAQLTLLFEDFEDVVLGPTVDEGVEDAGGTVASSVWSDAPPVSDVPTTAGGMAPWTIDDSGIPVSGAPDENGNPEFNGITEWLGWATVDKDWWVDTAGDQDRSQFTRGTGNVFVADPDEWDDGPKDYGTPPDFYDARARTPVVTIPAGIPAGRIQLAFDSSWRPEGFDDFPSNNQTAVIRAIYNGGTPIQVLRWDSDDEGDFFKPGATNERVTLDLEYDGMSTSVQLEFALENAANDWWWAIDNVLVSVPTDPAKLRINTANGQAFFGGDDTIASQIKSISITSKTNLLQVVNGGGLSSALNEAADGPDPGDTPGDSPGEQWEPLTSTDKQFSEAFLFGSSSFNDLRQVLLGVLIDPNTFDQLFAEATDDIEVTYSLATGDVVNGVVEYFFEQTLLPGDYNDDGMVDAADYVIWRKNENTSNQLSNDPHGGLIDARQYNTWRANFGSSFAGSGGASSAVPEPGTLLLAALGLAAFGLVKRPRCVSALLVFAVATMGMQRAATAALPPSPWVDRLYLFGDDDAGGIIGQPVSQTDGMGNLVTFDSAGDLGMDQLIDLIAVSPTTRKATYVSTADRPDGEGGIGLRLNELTIDRQYLRTGFGEALNFPEQSPSSRASLINPPTTMPDGRLNYFRINDRGFELWAKPTAVTGTHHIAMDSQQHGVLIKDGKFEMRYGSRYEVQTEQLPGEDGVLGTEDDVLIASDPVITAADYATDVTAQVNQWYHLSVVRPLGPNQGSIFYINGVAESIAFGEYAVETIVNVGEGEVFTNIDSLDVSPLTVGRATTLNTDFSLPLEDSFFFRGVVDDLQMYVMGLNDNDNLPGGGTDVLNDWGEYVFQRDNGYAQAFAPTTDGDMDGDEMITMTDANLFASNWLFEKRLTAVNPITDVESSRLVGDLFSRAHGDFNYDGIVDLRDWAILNNADPGTGAAAMSIILGDAAIPEPSTLALIGLGSVVVASGARRRLQGSAAEAARRPSRRASLTRATLEIGNRFARRNLNR